MDRQWAAAIKAALGLALLCALVFLSRCTPEARIQRQVQKEVKRFQQTKPSTVLKSKKLEDYVKAGVVKRRQIVASSALLTHSPKFKKMWIRPIYSVKPYQVNGQWMDTEHTTGKRVLPRLTDVCVENCAQLLYPLEELELVRDAEGNIHFPIQ